MSDAKELGIAPATAGTGGGAAVSLGKGAWDCDANREIPPEKEARPPARTPRTRARRRVARLGRGPAVFGFGRARHRSAPLPPVSGAHTHRAS
jgi:hypothetical protein